MPRHDPQSNRLLLLAVFVCGGFLVYLNLHKPDPRSTPSNRTPSPLDQVRQRIANHVEKQWPVTPEQAGERVIHHRIVAVGDIHGDYPALTAILRKARLVDLKGQWIGGDTVLVQTGDIVDRGADTIACYRFMQTLRPQAEKAGGAVVSLLGNHEIMNALGDWRYVNPTDIKSFGGERNRREAMLTGWIGREWRSNYSITARVPYLYHSFPSPETVVTLPTTPPGSSDRRFLSEPSPFLEPSTGSSGENPFVSAAVSFVHGGITPEYLETLPRSDSPVSEMNRIGHSLMTSLVDVPGGYPMSLPRSATKEQRLFWSERGPMWNRDWALEDEADICDRVERTCRILGVRRLVMGHTPHFEGIRDRCAGPEGSRVVLIDTGISRAYGGAHSFLDISHSLTPASLVPLDDPLAFELVTSTEKDDDARTSRWVEREVVKAVYQDHHEGDDEEVLVRSAGPAMSIMDFDDDDALVAVPSQQRLARRGGDGVSSTSSSTLAHSTKARRRSIALHRCRFPDWTPAAITCLSLTPTSFDAGGLGAGGATRERGVLAVGRSNGDVELMLWGGYQGWISWRTLPSSFPVPSASSSSRKPSSLLSHLTWTHQTTLSPSDVSMYEGDLEGATAEVERLRKGKGVRLFGVGGVGSELVEWEWGGHGSGKAVGMVKSTLPTLPPVFALAASPSSATLAVACEDSTIRLLNILDGELELMGKIEVGGPGKVRALSLAWGMPFRNVEVEEDEGDESEEKKGKERASIPSSYSTPRESYLLAGCSNSTIRRFDAPTTSTTSLTAPWHGTLRMTLDRLKGEHTVVWALATLEDGTVVSGDSMGNVKFWDGEMGTQLQSFKAHKSDVLCLGVGSDGSSIFTSGIDQKTVEFRLVSVASARSDANLRWIQSSGRRLHSHDVRAIVVSPPYEPYASTRASGTTPTSKTVPVMTSAGLDLSLILTPVAPPRSTTTSSKRKTPQLANPVSNNPSITFESTVHRRAAYVPQRSRPFSVAGGDNGRLLVGRRDRSVTIWRLGEPRTATGIHPGDSDAPAHEGSGWDKLVELEFKLQTNLVASEVSPDGRWLAVSDLYETKLFRLTSSRAGDLVPRRQKTFTSVLAGALPSSLGTGSSRIAFSKDSSRLILSTAFGTTVAVVTLPQQASQPEEFDVVAVFAEGKSLLKAKKLANGHGLSNGDGDVEMNGGSSSNEGSDSESDEDEDDERFAASRFNSPTSIVGIAISDDGRWLAAADLERNVEVYDLEHGKPYVRLPTPPTVPTSLAFLPSRPSSPSSDSYALEPTLVLTFSTNTLLLYGLTSRRFHPWSLPLSSSKYNVLTDIREPSLGVTFEPSASSKRPAHVALVYGANWVAKIDLDELRSSVSSSSHSTGPRKKPFRLEMDRKRAREESDDFSYPSESASSTKTSSAMVDIKVTRKYQPLCLFEFVNGSELVAVERTWYDLVGELPEAWIKSGVFGT
ncbi:hypothetical protein JCM10212_005067 [Sporobolomyces blumeae]